jgi:hypothetical protein
MHMRSVQVSKANGRFEIVERDIPEPSAAQVRSIIPGVLDEQMRSQLILHLLQMRHA